MTPDSAARVADLFAPSPSAPAAMPFCWLTLNRFHDAKRFVETVLMRTRSEPEQSFLKTTADVSCNGGSKAGPEVETAEARRQYLAQREARLQTRRRTSRLLVAFNASDLKLLGLGARPPDYSAALLHAHGPLLATLRDGKVTAE